MSKAGYLARYGTIYQFLERRPYSSYEQLIDVLQSRSDLLQHRSHRARMGISQRTVQRDFEEMRALFGIRILYDRKRKGLFLEESGNALVQNFRQLVEAQAISSALVEGTRYAPYLKLSAQPYRGLESLPEYLEAITARRCLALVYAPFEEEKTARTVAPYQIREYDGRWYLVALDTAPEVNAIRCFALDRIESYQVLEKRFEAPNLAALDEKYAPCMGITTPDEAALEVLLSFDWHQAHYVRTLPLHASQEVVEENAKKLVVRIKVYDSWELRAKIRSYGSAVEVLSPSSLRAKIATDLKRSLKSYQ